MIKHTQNKKNKKNRNYINKHSRMFIRLLVRASILYFLEKTRTTIIKSNTNFMLYIEFLPHPYKQKKKKKKLQKKYKASIPKLKPMLDQFRLNT
jgi:hypothetical protein